MITRIECYIVRRPDGTLYSLHDHLEWSEQFCKWLSNDCWTTPKKEDEKDQDWLAHLAAKHPPTAEDLEEIYLEENDTLIGVLVVSDN